MSMTEKTLQPGVPSASGESRDELVRQRDLLIRQLLRYGAHTSDCASRSASGAIFGPCDCGWSEVRAAMAGNSPDPSD